MKSRTAYLTFNLPARMAFENITSKVEAVVRQSGVTEGLVLCNAMHITASVFINDDESGLHIKKAALNTFVLNHSWGQAPSGRHADEHGPYGGFRIQHVVLAVVAPLPSSIARSALRTTTVHDQ